MSCSSWDVHRPFDDAAALQELAETFTLQASPIHAVDLRTARECERDRLQAALTVPAGRKVQR